VADLCRFSENIDALTVRIVRRVKDLGSTLPTLPGCAELTAAKLILEAANVDRFPNESGFARYAGLAPIPAWSGSTIGRMRVCPFGNRQINTAIHRIAVVQLRLDCPGRAYYRRRRAEGDSGAKAVRVPIAAPVPGGVQPLTRRLRGATAARARRALITAHHLLLGGGPTAAVVDPGHATATPGVRAWCSHTAAQDTEASAGPLSPRRHPGPR